MAKADEKKFDMLSRHVCPCDLCSKEFADYMVWNETYGRNWIFLGEDCYKRYKTDLHKRDGIEGIENQEEDDDDNEIEVEIEVEEEEEDDEEYFDDNEDDA